MPAHFARACRPDARAGVSSDSHYRSPSQAQAGRLLLRAPGAPTPEHDALRAFLSAAGCAGAPERELLARLPQRWPRNWESVPRRADVTPGARTGAGRETPPRADSTCFAPRPAAEVAACLAGDGAPLVVADALRDWDAARRWTPASLRARFGADAVAANDRAPARHGDAAAGRPQRSAPVTLADYLEYYEYACAPASAPAGTDGADGAPPRSLAPGAPPPFYLNGWRAPSQHPVRGVLRSGWRLRSTQRACDVSTGSTPPR